MAYAPSLFLAGVIRIRIQFCLLAAHLHPSRRGRQVVRGSGYDAFAAQHCAA
jgi:hypothetical protein